MLKVSDVMFLSETLICFYVCIEGDKSTKYEMTVDVSDWDDPVIVSSEIPKDEWIYERQVLVALTIRKNEDISKGFTAMWY